MKKILSFWWCIPLFIALLFCYSTQWVLDTYDNPSFEQILFHITEPITGVETTLLLDFLEKCVLISLVEAIVISFALSYITKLIKTKKKIIIFKVFIVIVSIITYVICFYLLGVFEYFSMGNYESTFIEDNYVNPREVELTFPDEKRNLIYIFVESLESSYTSSEMGGLKDENLIPELTTLAEDNLYFSDTDKIGGAYQLNGTTWTSAAMVAQTAGIPLKMGRILSNNYEISGFLSGVYTLGDILFWEGYNQSIIFGSEGDFGNRGAYFNNHGFYDVQDYNYAIGKGKIPSDYYVWWGYEDSKLFEYAKEEALNLSSSKKPFNLTLLTVNSHQPDGYLEDSCPKLYDNQYENVIACTSYQVNQFIEWCKKQDFYEDTTIIIVGDHLTMADSFFKLSENDDRRVFNTFINSAINTENNKNRLFSTMDLFPTTLAAMGVSIEGDKLGLGTNLFSNKKTLLELYGFEYVDEELSYKSDFYNNKILNMDN